MRSFGQVADSPAALMERAWTARRESLSASDEVRDRLVADAREWLQEAIELSRRDGLESGVAQAKHLLANLELDAGNTEDAVNLWESAVDICRKLDNPTELAHKLRHLAQVYGQSGQSGQHARSARAFDESMMLYRSETHERYQDHANAAAAYAHYLETRGSIDEAITLWEEARQQYGVAAYDEGVTYADLAVRRLSRKDEA
jgi:tetratricopeptide (TPR) repeat protein